MIAAQSKREVDEERIKAAIASIWHDAGLDALDCATTQSLIVPLDALVSSFPIVVRERDGLTYGRAAEFLGGRKGRPVAMPGPDGQCLAGFLYFEPSYACILTCRSTQIEIKTEGQTRKVWRQEFVTRRRFTIAHELGHYLLHFWPALSNLGNRLPVFAEGLRPSIKDDEDSPLESDLHFADGAQDWQEETTRLEAEANAFAAALLMPAVTLQRAVEMVSPRLGAQRDTLARRLAGEFLVSQQAMKRRLDQLELGIE